MNPLISVIIPVYNVENFLRECLNSVANQTYTNLEIILIDDGSTDKSGLICDEFAARDSRFKVLHQKNTGQSVARNKDLNVANGEFITFVDSDDIIDSSLVTTLFDLTQKFSTKIAMCGYKEFTQNSEISAILDNNKFAKNDERLEQNELFSRALYRDAYFMSGVPRALYAKEIWENLRFPEGEIYEDVAIWFDIFNASPSALTYKNLYFYRIRKGSTVNSFEKKHLAIIKNVRKFADSIASAYPNLAKKAASTKCNSALNTAFNIIRANKMGEFSDTIDELHKFVRKNLNLTYFLIPNKAYKVVMMVLFYISPKCLEAFYKMVKKVRK